MANLHTGAARSHWSGQLDGDGLHVTQRVGHITATYVFGPLNGALAIVEITVKADGNSQDGISARLLRRLSASEAIQQARTMIRSAAVASGIDAGQWATWLEASGQIGWKGIWAAAGGPAGSEDRAERLAGVAAMYESARASGATNVNQAIAAQLSVPPETVRELVRAARSANYLSRNSDGRGRGYAHGVLTEAGREVLEAWGKRIDRLRRNVVDLT